MKWLTFLVAILTVFVLTSCQQVADTRTQACNAMRDASQKLTDLKSAVLQSQPVQTVKDARATIADVRTKIQTAQTVYTAVKNSQNTAQLIAALNELEASLQGAQDTTKVSDLKDKLSVPVTKAQAQAAALYDATCSAK
jgi:hypothetical protein